ncbi:apses transcription factor-like protein [Sporormia fimetaria CBS 119925]|uniref:Transcription factor SWI6 n=1 Tax=Sporormia fimetaria CBS 119925 TaxID=1340428 RepID=A0A6A6V4B2_9PLEO|nr:apses transcription factor-like protein [Sporormia fimetaria CBS 119925]
MQVARTNLAASFPSGTPPQANMYNNHPPNQAMAAPPTYTRSFSDMNGYPQGAMEKPQIYTAVYSGVSVYEMEVNGVAVMRRRSDGWLNATQILKVAGVDKGKRTKVLEKEILTGDHEKVQGGYGKYQGTWINYRRGREFCRQYGVEDLLRPLLDYDINDDGHAGQGIETPTKEQAMAANRKRFYTQSMDGRTMNQNVGGTFFSNISSTATSALAAMNKVARMTSPHPGRPASASQRRSMARPSQAPLGSQDSFRASSQQSVHSLASEKSFGPNGTQDSTYGTLQDDIQEPPRKRMRPSQEESFSQPNGVDMSMHNPPSPTEPAESFYQPAHHITLPDGEVPTALPPLPLPETKAAEEKQALLTDLFADQTRTDFTNHPAILHLSGQDLDLPIDNSSNTALHWAATLARVSLMRLLVSKGANMFRGNAAGQTPLMSAVSVNNSLDHSCFPETLEILAPLIELRDSQGRSILHHIAVTCAIKGRAASSKYYLEALLEYLVRSNTSNNSQSQDTGSQYGKPIGLMRFMQEMVNARDNSGNTALNLAARIGNRNIISQLMEVQADPTIANHKGTRPIDFGVGTDASAPTPATSQSPSKGKTPISKVEETAREIQPLISTLLQTSSMQHTQETRLKQELIDSLNREIADLSSSQKHQQHTLDTLRQRLRTYQDRGKRIANLKRWQEAQLQNLAVTVGGESKDPKRREPEHADREGAGVVLWETDFPHEVRPVWDRLALSGRKATNGGSYLDVQIPIDEERFGQAVESLRANPTSKIASLPSAAWLRQRVEAYSAMNRNLAERSKRLKEKDGEREMQYRRVVSLCTKVEEERIDEVLEGLVQALESDPLEGVEVGRVAEFLRKVEGVEG